MSIFFTLFSKGSNVASMQQNGTASVLRVLSLVTPEYLYLIILRLTGWPKIVQYEM
jgi:hypothetical protein